MHARYRIVLIAGLLAMVAGAAMAQGIGLGFGMHEGRGKGSGTGTATSCGAMQLDHSDACNSITLMIVGA